MLVQGRLGEGERCAQAMVDLRERVADHGISRFAGQLIQLRPGEPGPGAGFPEAVEQPGEGSESTGLLPTLEGHCLCPPIAIFLLEAGAEFVEI